MQKSNQQSREAALKYFLTQTFASIFLLFSRILLLIFNYRNIIIVLRTSLLILALGLKIGAAPLHFWFPATVQGLSWTNCFILMTWQKLAPLFLITTISSSILPILAVTSSLVGALGGFNQTLLRKILAYSSINHLGWLITTTIIREKILIIYFLIYVVLNITVIYILNNININHLSQIPSQNKSNNTSILLATNLLSLGGIPPFLGFLPKWIIISQIITKIPLQVFLITISSLLTLYFYLRITYTLLIKSPAHAPIQEIFANKLIFCITIISTTSILFVAPII